MVNENSTLYVVGHEELNGSADMYVSGLLDKERTLFIEGRALEVNDSIYLFVYNDVTMGLGSIALYIKADGVWEGNVPYSENRTLFLEQWGEGNEATLFTHGNSEVNTYITLYTINFEMLDDDITLVIPNVYGTANTYANLYIGGCVYTENDCFLHTHGIDEVNGNTTLYMCQNQATINSYISMYTVGALKENDVLYLCMPNVIDNNDNSISLYLCQNQGSVNSYAPLYLCQNQATINSYISMYVHGVYETNETMLLCMPNVVDDDDDEFPLYIFGW